MRAGQEFGEDQVENPPVNPVTGANRTYASMRDELRKHYETIRVNAAIKPIFLSDFIFFKVHGKGAQLGRVVRAPFGGALQPSDTVDVTELEHTPQHGTAGFFGTFKALKNEHYNKNMRGSLQYVRHRDMSRQNVLVFNVQTFGTSDCVRVCLSSLRELQQISADHPIPARIPATHQQDQQHREERSNRIRIPRPELATPSAVPPVNCPAVVKPGDRIQVYWTEDPVGWFEGVVTSSRRENGVWVSRVQYNTCEQWQQSHHAWHRLDPSVDDHVTWRFAK